MLTLDLEAQVTQLATCYGFPRRVAVELNSEPFRPISSRDRVGEVCMVVRRPNGRLLTATKTFYPPGAFRLLTGGIKHHELIEEALLRETHEETGLEVVVRRFLAVIEYTLTSLESHSPSRPDFVTFAFLLDEIGGVLGVQDESEQLGEFRELEPAELPAQADRLDAVANGFHPEIAGKWRDWGHFRAVVHRVVYEALSD